MQLFDDLSLPTINFLPKDGTVNYYGSIFNKTEADFYYESLLNNIHWENDQAVIFGKLIITKRKVAWYGEKPFKYTYSNITKTALPWTKELLALKQKAEALSGETFNSCLLNLYHNGDEGMAWHSDAEKDLKQHGTIASLSLGESRRFLFKHKLSHEKVEIQLAHGSLLLMKGTTQSHWLHHLPTTKRSIGARINLTFRCVERTHKPQF